MKLAQDEAMQSWIYRCLLVNGVTDFSSVITTNGNWYLTPRFPIKHAKLFTFSCDKELFNLFVKSSMGLKNLSFITPWAYAEEIRKYLRGMPQYMTRGGSAPITYCTLCIRESIKVFGFGYIKSQWLFGRQCEIHNTNLISLHSKSRQKTVLLLGDILSGKSGLKGTAYSRNWSPSIGYIDPEHILPCLIMEFYWTASNRYSKQFPRWAYNDFFDSIGKRIEVHDFFQGNGISLLSFANQKLEYFATRYPKELAIFFKEKSEAVTLKYGINKPDSFTENLVAKKGRNCSKCHRWSTDNACPINPIISSFRVNEGGQNPVSPGNMCDKSLEQGY